MARELNMSSFSLRAIMLAAVLAFAVPAANAQSNAVNGKELYVKYTCYGCHGFSGQNGPGIKLVPMKMTQEGFTGLVRTPSNRQMPSYSAKVISDAQLGDIWTYMKTLPDSPAAKDIPLLNQILNQAK
jgi:mono/diheme cytochrome c family protein